jgi:hypothetical protein
MKRIVATWWPLAASWLLMSLESPAVNSIIARLHNPTISLAAYGGLVMPIAFVIEAPIIMLLSASTALCKDYASYNKIWKIMMVMGAVLSAIHILVAFTPLYDFIARQVLGAPQEIIEPARLGLRLMLPFPWAVGYRRFNQGVLIRFGHSSAVMNCTMIRLTTLAVVLGVGYAIGTIPGVIVGTAAVGLAVTLEGLYAGWRVRPVLTREVKMAPPVEAVTLRSFSAFYVPLMLTTMLGFLGMPIASAALSRMPQAVDSLASWSVVSGLIFILRSFGMALNEVVVALMEEPGSSHGLRRFTTYVIVGSTSFALFVAVTPLALIWFRDVVDLPVDLVPLARGAFWFVVIAPLISALQSWFQGSILYGRRTRGITESIVVNMAALVLVLVIGVAWGKIPGLYVGVFGLIASGVAQTAWLWLRSRPIMREIRARDG